MKRRILKKFEGFALNQLELMSKEGYVPLSIAGIMKAKVEFGNNTDLRREWVQQNILGTKHEPWIDSTGANTRLIRDSDHMGVSEEWMPHSLQSFDAFYLDKNGDVKLVLSDERLMSLKEKDLENKFSLGGNGALLLPNIWDSLTGKNVLHIPYKRLVQITKKGHTAEEAKLSNEWNFVSRDRGNLEKFVDFSFPRRYHACEYTKKTTAPELLSENNYMRLHLQTLGSPAFRENYCALSQNYIVMYPLNLKSYSRDTSDLSAITNMVFKRKLDYYFGDIPSVFIGVDKEKREKYLS